MRGFHGRNGWWVSLAAVLAIALFPAGNSVPGDVQRASPPQLRTTQIVLPVGPLPLRPMLMQLNARVLMTELSQKLGRPTTLDDIQDATLDEIAINGYHIVYLLGVWKTGQFGLQKSQKLLLQDPCMQGLPETAVSSSPFAIVDYSVANELGGNDALERLCSRIRSRRMRVIVDFVPNHVAIDHPWVNTHPHLLIQSRNDEHTREPGSYFAAAGKLFAFGRGLLWEPWEDTVQLNYGEPELRKAMCDILRKIAGMVDGVRCDVAMLVEQELLVSTWGPQLVPERDPALEVTTEFWPAACHEVRAVNPSFIFVAESYWEREKALMEKGFDFCYDKVLYDRLVQGDGEGVDQLLDLDRAYQDKLVRFLENHDEDRAASVFPNVEQHIAAAILTLTAPGLHFVHDGQQAGRQRRVSMHITYRLPEDEDVQEKTLKARYKALMIALKSAAFRDGGWERCQVYEIMHDGNYNPCKRVISHFCWNPITGGGPFTEVVLVVVNYSPHPATVRVVGKEGQPGSQTLRELLQGRDCMLSDRLSLHSAHINGESFTGVCVLFVEPECVCVCY